jgi:hypothetical protein
MIPGLVKDNLDGRQAVQLAVFIGQLLQKLRDKYPRLEIVLQKEKKPFLIGWGIVTDAVRAWKNRDNKGYCDVGTMDYDYIHASNQQPNEQWFQVTLKDGFLHPVEGVTPDKSNYLITYDTSIYRDLYYDSSHAVKIHGGESFATKETRNGPPKDRKPDTNYINDQLETEVNFMTVEMPFATKIPYWTRQEKVKGEMTSEPEWFMDRESEAFLRILGVQQYFRQQKFYDADYQIPFASLTLLENRLELGVLDPKMEKTRGFWNLDHGYEESDILLAMVDEIVGQISKHSNFHKVYKDIIKQDEMLPTLFLSGIPDPKGIVDMALKHKARRRECDGAMYRCYDSLAAAERARDKWPNCVAIMFGDNACSNCQEEREIFENIAPDLAKIVIHVPEDSRTEFHIGHGNEIVIHELPTYICKKKGEKGEIYMPVSLEEVGSCKM